MNAKNIAIPSTIKSGVLYLDAALRQVFIRSMQYVLLALKYEDVFAAF